MDFLNHRSFIRRIINNLKSFRYIKITIIKTILLINHVNIRLFK